MTFGQLDARAERGPRTEPIEPAFLIGLTGPMGCGKTTVGRMLGRLGGRIVDADQVSRAVLAPDQPVLDDLKARFGKGIISNDGTLDRTALANLVFHDPVALRDLEAMTHPLIRLRIDQALELAAEDGVPFAVVEAIKLIENEELAGRCDEIWLIDCAPAIQRERIIERGLGGSDMDERLAAQAGIRERARARADRVIDTSGPLEEVQAAVEEALASALAGQLDILPFGSVQR
jgi:dephospho-CoA kinase